MPKTILNYKGYGIEKDSISKKELDELKKELTVKPNVIPDYDFGTESFPVFRQNSTRIYLPKFYGMNKYGEPSQRDKRHGRDISLQFKTTLRPYQQIFCERILDELKYRDGCVGCSGTGSGKTVCALYILTRLQKKTLIVVHKEFLMQQWIERIKQFIPGARVGIIRQKKVDVQNKDIVIAMLQSVAMREYPKEIFDDIGNVIADEIHHICSRTFSKALFKIGTHKVLGLSATPHRKDGLTKVLKWFAGDILNSGYKGGQIDTPSVEILEAKYIVPISLKYNFKGKINHADLINQISLDETRNKLIVEQINKYVKKGRKILILSDRRKQCTIIESFLYANKNISYTVGLYLGSMKEHQLNDANKCDVILATYSMAAEGYDNPNLDTLIMATGKSDIEQAVGRVLRKKNKNPPLIIDIADPSYCANQIRTRKHFYKKKGWKIIDNVISKKKQPKLKDVVFRD